MEKIIGTVPGKCRKKREKARLCELYNPEISWHMKKSRRTYNGVHLNKKSNTQDVVEQSLTVFVCKLHNCYQKIVEHAISPIPIVCCHKVTCHHKEITIFVGLSSIRL